MQGSPNLPPPINLRSKPDSSVQSHQPMKLSRSSKSIWVWLSIVLVVFLVIVGAIFSWYSMSLRPVDQPGNASEKRVIVRPGDGVNSIAENLKAANLIRSTLAFRIYSESSGLKSSLQAGGYVINSSQSTQDIIRHMTSGKTDEFDITIIPGKTTEQIAKELVSDGFAARDVETAMAAEYDHPLLVDKPQGSSLEGYIYPETYRLMADDQAREVILRSFDQFKKTIDENNLLPKLKKHGLNLHQAIILASIVQLEVPDPEDQRQVAQVFLKRLDEDMPLGSDPTFKYAAMLDGATPTINYDSPYNTRLYKGLPPGPIANFNLSALEAVANPAKGDYLYFVSGDDGRTHFSHTLEQHEALTARYCTDLCQ